MKLTHLVEYAALRSFLGITGHLPLPLASALGAAAGAFAATLPARFNRTAVANLQKVFPQQNMRWICRTHMASMASLGRTATEFSRIYTMPNTTFNHLCTVHGWHHIETHPDALVLTAHFGNWEATARAFGVRQKPMANIYRKANNPLAERYITGLREKAGGIQIPKGSHGAKQLLALMRRTDTVVGFLNDQKFSGGIHVPFLGQNATTAPALAELARKYNKPVVPIFCFRTVAGLHLRFTIEISPPLVLQKTDDPQADIHANTLLFNQVIETAIRRAPEQWLWAHSRFGKSR